MVISTQRARITGPVTYQMADGRPLHIPLGPCLLERNNDVSIDIVWGAQGQRSAALPLGEVQAARDRGYLVLLD